MATGNADEKEVINCVLPLFDGDDCDLGPILKSKLYHILMTFNVMKNVDTCFESAYAAVINIRIIFNSILASWKYPFILDLLTINSLER